MRKRAWPGIVIVLGAALLLAGMAFAGQTYRLTSVSAELNAVREALNVATAMVGYRDPTYSELVRFLKEDRTEENQYDADSYNCRNFAADLKEAAAAQGFRTGFVSIRFREGSHAVVAFDTVDRGILYVEPQFGKPVVLNVGESYTGSNGFKLATESQDDVVEQVMVIW